MKGFILGKSLINVKSVESVLAELETSTNIKEHTTKRSLISANNVASVLAKHGA